MTVTVGDLVLAAATELAGLHADAVNLRDVLNAPARVPGTLTGPVPSAITLPPPAAPTDVDGAIADLKSVIAGAIADLELAIEKINVNAISSSGGALEHIQAALDKLKGGT